MASNLAQSFDCKECGIASFPYLGETELCLQCAYKRLKENFDYETWAHAGCLCLAEGYEAYSKPNTDWSEAMKKVKRLRKEYDEMKLLIDYLGTERNPNIYTAIDRAMKIRREAIRRAEGGR